MNELSEYRERKGLVNDDGSIRCEYCDGDGEGDRGPCPDCEGDGVTADLLDPSGSGYVPEPPWDDVEADLDEHEACGGCGGTVLVALGTLGATDWYRCRACGLEVAG